VCEDSITSIISFMGRELPLKGITSFVFLLIRWELPCRERHPPIYISTKKVGDSRVPLRGPLLLLLNL
jgi:hypothetical protein